MRVYIAAPLFNESELERNRRLRDFVRSLGYDTYLPQEDGGVAFDLITSGADMAQTRREIFAHDVQEIEACDVLLCVLDGRVPDEGMCVELGVAYAKGKRSIGYVTDTRTLDAFGHNLMIEGCLEGVAHSREELRTLLG